jgi:AraC family transcriptional activator of pobA
MPSHAPRPLSGAIPNFALYGHTAQPSWLDMVHVERIPVRSSLFDFEIEPHVHAALVQVLFVTAGGGEVSIDDTKWAMPPPCVVMIPANAVHAFRFSSEVDGHVVTTAQRPLEAVAQVVAPELLATLRRPAVLRVSPASRCAEALPALFEALERETRLHEPGQMAMGLSLMVALLVQIARVAAQPAAAGGEANLRSRKARQVERFRALVDESYRERRPLESYAGALGVTPGQLSRVCRDVLGMSALDVLNARLVHEAQRELAYSVLSIKQIAALLGFEDEAYFGRFFKKHTGHRPTEFRGMARRKLEGHS